MALPALIATLSLLAPWLSAHLLGHEPTAIDLDHNFAPPGSRHWLGPNVSSLIIVIAAFDVAGGIMVESGLSFLGVGVQPPDASWGSMLLHSRTYTTKAPWLVITPGFFIFATILSIFLLADGLRDALDPWLKE